MDALVAMAALASGLRRPLSLCIPCTPDTLKRKLASFDVFILLFTIRNACHNACSPQLLQVLTTWLEQAKMKAAKIFVDPFQVCLL